MELYSLLLLTALGSLVVSSIGTVLGWRGAKTATIVAVVAVTSSLVVHVLSGHRPGSEDGLAPPAFIAGHPTLFGALIAAAGLWWWQTRRSGNR